MARPMDTVVLSISPVKGISASLRGALGRLGIQRQVSIIEDSSSLRSEKAQMTERLPDNMKARLHPAPRAATFRRVLPYGEHKQSPDIAPEFSNHHFTSLRSLHNGHGTTSPATQRGHPSG
ncbi:uncharacterized protein AFUA_2G04160 [Aspergillus fumigatus Af293]|uniref:Uncharacterized protein n=2 Tax=Aspergillus fumigatus TaxID=746128 RepID=Q4WHU5_ASPFU|nr:hypothetical protein AFUA_2G04160 [Aspergillus fumigatus Af293]EAL87510.1 hypothetical protein AFUA_2G04160 [Aspergillus fumigatus Af293]EDP54073.1 hypothetical protein AFUB_021230 [Aspergillus fumigatus A1163]